jgi:hypothetical protein
MVRMAAVEVMARFRPRCCGGEQRDQDAQQGGDDHALEDGAGLLEGVGEQLLVVTREIVPEAHTASPQTSSSSAACSTSGMIRKGTGFSMTIAVDARTMPSKRTTRSITR